MCIRDRSTGTANAIYQNLDYMETFHPDYVLILSGDHIYKMDYEVMLDLSLIHIYASGDGGGREGKIYPYRT